MKGKVKNHPLFSRWGKKKPSQVEGKAMGNVVAYFTAH